MKYIPIVFFFVFSMTNLSAQEIDLDSLKFEALQQYRIETTLKNDQLNQIMSALQEANASIVPDSLSNIMKGFPSEFMRKTEFGEQNQDTKKSEKTADFKGRYRTYFRNETNQIPDYKQDLRSNGYE